MGLTPPARAKLDPADWFEFREFLSTISVDVAQYLQNLGDQPVWTKPKEESCAALNTPAPRVGQGVEATYDEFKQHILPHLTGNLHPKFWGWVVGSGIPSSMVGDWLAAFSNGVPTLFDETSLRTELQVLEWTKQLIGIDQKASGILTTGVSEATLIALTVARYAAFGDSLKRSGLVGLNSQPVFYISDQTHDCARKAIGILGFGQDHIRVITTNSRYQMDIKALSNAVARDRKAGLRPIAVIATLGTVNTGAFDDVTALSEICRANDIWLHVDGAFGIWTAITDDYTHLTDGVEFADSVVFDMHKWMYQTYDIGCALIRDSDLHERALGVSADYLAHIKGTLRDAPEELSSRAIQLSRGFRALKFWFSLKSEGAEAFGDAISQNIHHADYLTSLIEESDHLELLTPTTLHIVNFRYRGTLQSETEYDQCNMELLRRLHSEGIAIPSSTIIDGKFAIRICFSGHRTVERDIDQVFDQIVRIGQKIATDNRAADR